MIIHAHETTSIHFIGIYPVLMDYHRCIEFAVEKYCNYFNLNIAKIDSPVTCITDIK